MFVVRCDGTAAPNPGAIGMGVVVVTPAGVEHRFAHASDARGCNNEAEARALAFALQQAHALGARRVRVHSDSAVVVAHVGGDAITHVARLAPLYAQARAWCARFDDVTLQLVPRARLADADALARAALGLAPSSTVVHRAHNDRRRRRRAR